MYRRLHNAGSVINFTAAGFSPCCHRNFRHTDLLFFFWLFVVPVVYKSVAKLIFCTHISKDCTNEAGGDINSFQWFGNNQKQCLYQVYDKIHPVKRTSTILKEKKTCCHTIAEKNTTKQGAETKEKAKCWTWRLTETGSSWKTFFPLWCLKLLFERSRVVFTAMSGVWSRHNGA